MFLNIKKHLFIINILLFCILFWSCSGQIDDDKKSQFTNLEFTYLQDVNKLYFGVAVNSKYDGIPLDSVFIAWYSTNIIANPPFYIDLFDDGTHGDIITNDNLYARKIANTTSAIQHVINDGDTSDIYLEYNAIYGTELVSLLDTVKIGNFIPKILSIYAEDTIVRPSGSDIHLYPVAAKINDANGLETIRWVGFTSYHVEREAMMNNGNYIYLYDDGSDVILYEPNFTSGDTTRDDGVFTFKIPIYGSESDTSEPYHTKPGTYKWRFSAQDLSNEYSQVVEHEIIIQ